VIHLTQRFHDFFGFSLFLFSLRGSGVDEFFPTPLLCSPSFSAAYRARAGGRERCPRRLFSLKGSFPFLRLSLRASAVRPAAFGGHRGHGAAPLCDDLSFLFFSLRESAARGCPVGQSPPFFFFPLFVAGLEHFAFLLLPIYFVLTNWAGGERHATRVSFPLSLRFLFPLLFGELGWLESEAAALPWQALERLLSEAVSEAGEI